MTDTLVKALGRFEAFHRALKELKIAIETHYAGELLEITMDQETYVAVAADLDGFLRQSKALDESPRQLLGVDIAIAAQPLAPCMTREEIEAQRDLAADDFDTVHDEACSSGLMNERDRQERRANTYRLCDTALRYVQHIEDLGTRREPSERNDADAYLADAGAKFTSR